MGVVVSGSGGGELAAGAGLETSHVNGEDGGVDVDHAAEACDYGGNRAISTDG